MKKRIFRLVWAPDGPGNRMGISQQKTSRWRLKAPPNVHPKRVNLIFSIVGLPLSSRASTRQAYTSTMLRHLLGNPDKKLVHDPGPKGESGEGEAAMTMLVLTYASALGILMYGASLPAKNIPFRRSRSKRPAAPARPARARVASTSPLPARRPRIPRAVRKVPRARAPGRGAFRPPRRIHRFPIPRP